MKWNRIKLLKAGRANGFEGKTAEQFADFVDENLMEFEGLDTRSDIIKAFNKTVTITADAGEDVVVTEQAPAELAEDGEDAEIKMEDELDPEQVKQFKEFRAYQKQGMAALQNGSANPAADHMPTRKRFGDARSAKMLAYDRKIKDGTKITKTGHTPLFGDAERMEAFNAAIRLHAMEKHGYEMAAQDRKTVTKDHSVGINTTGGAFVFGEYFPEVIENLSEYGAARAAAGVTPMREGRRVVTKLHDDITVGDIGEGEAMTASDVLTGTVELNASKSYALAKISMELLNDSAVNIEDTIVASMFRALRGYEDDCYFNSANNREGLSSKVGSNSTVDSNLAGRSTANWGGYVTADIQNALASVASWAAEDPNFGIACSWQFYMSVLRRIGLSAGGTTGQSILNGLTGPGLTSKWEWDGLPVYINNKAPKAYNADQTDAYVGAFSSATKLGVVTGSEQVATTDQRWFDEDKFGIKITQRWAMNCHDVNDEALSASTDAGSGIAALKA